MAKVELDIRAQIANLNKGLKTTQAQLKDLQTQSKQTSQKMQANMNSTSQAANQLKSALTGVFAIGTAVSLAKSIISVRAEFEKFEAMLKVALGSAEAANREFAKIQQFAAKTPFSVRELTDSFVKLVNQGFKPTMREMTAMGDLAAAMGKDFIQLTEAVIDAQVGEFERLKEFGIRASKNGDEVSLSFKGVEKQVAFTAEAIQQAIIGFGEMDGVMGTMDEVSKTLGGQLSNLGDSITSLANELGKMAAEDVGNGISVIKNLAEILKAFTKLKENDNGALKILEKINLRLAQFVPMLRPIQSLKLGLESLGIITGEAAEALNELASGEEIVDEDIDSTNDKIIVQARSIETLQKEIKKLDEEKKSLSITDTVRIGEINRESEALKKQIEQLNKLGVALEPKALKQEDLVIADDEIFKIGEEMDKEELERKKEKDAAILESMKQRTQKELEIMLAAEEQKKLMNQGTVDAVNAGFDLLKAVYKDNAKAQQAINIAQAIMNGALGITKTGAELGYPAAIPFQIALALQTLAQIATIRAQKFERGGYDVLRGRRHAQGGVDIGIGEAEEGEGVAVFSRQATQKYGKFIPAFVKAMNENDATITGYGDKAYNISLDDSRQVNKLEDIRKLLSKPEIRYDGRYKIIERNGHTQKVSI